jgi:calcineurin-like phosphoesterase family protein
MEWYTSDEHYGHQRISELACRPFTSTEEMNAELIWRFNERVKKSETTFHLGDFAMGKIAETLPLVRQLNGAHILEPGNHDRCSRPYWHIAEDEHLGQRTEHSIKPMMAWARKYKDAGFLVVFTSSYSSWLDLPGNHQVTYSHFPYRGGGDSSDSERFTDYRLEDKGLWLLCGHVHNAWRQRGRMINVGVDAWGGYPVHQDQITELIEAGPRDLDPLPW